MNVGAVRVVALGVFAALSGCAGRAAPAVGSPASAAAAPPPARASALGAGGDVLAMVGRLPTPGLGTSLWLRFQPSSWSLEVGARGVLTPAPSTFGSASVDTTYLGGTVAACARPRVIFVCPTFEVGALLPRTYSTAGFEAIDTLAVSVGVRLGAEWRAYRGYVEIEGAPTRTRYLVAHTPVWASPSVAVTFGLGFEVRP